MFSYIMRRVLLMVFTLFVISIVSFAIVHSAPGDPFTQGLDPKADPVTADIKIEEYHLDAPLYEQYCFFYGSLMRDLWVLATDGSDSGKFSLVSFKTKEPVVPTMWRKAMVTLPLFLVELFLTWTLAFPIGIYSAMRRGTKQEAGVTVLSYAMVAIPPFALGMVVILILTTGMGIPVAGPTTVGTELTGMTNFMDRVWHIAVPAIVFALASIAVLSRFVKGQMLEVLEQDFVRTARAKGLSQATVNYKHALRNAALPFVTMLAGLLPLVFGGSIVLEALFSWPGLGKWEFAAVMGKDYSIVMTVLFVTSALTLLGILISDLLYVVVDPRIKLS
jgi:peptide/nickel transport system permease protein